MRKESQSQTNTRLDYERLHVIIAVKTAGVGTTINTLVRDGGQNKTNGEPKDQEQGKKQKIAAVELAAVRKLLNMEDTTGILAKQFCWGTVILYDSSIF